jgi:OmpA-OmpF porin, OOP family
VTSPNGQVVKDPFGLCWKTPWFTPAKAVAGCDDDLLPKAPPPPPPAPPKPVEAPKAVVAPPAAPPVAPRPPAPPAGPTIEKVTFAADAFFDVNKSVLKPEGKAKLDDLVSKLGGITLEVIIAVGHTDSDGSDAANQKLSVRRSEAVKAYMVSKGIEANRVYTEGKGEKQPVADNKTKEGKAKNRRVEIEVVGTRPIKK